MARSRNIKPGLYKNEELAECSIWSRYLFPGLWTIADKSGRLEDRPKRIKADLLPFDDKNVEPMLQELAQKGFILRYTANGQKYIQIIKFDKHQNPHFRESPSTIPAPTDEQKSLGLLTHYDDVKASGFSAMQSDESPRLNADGKPVEPRASPGLGTDKARPSPADSLIPDSPITALSKSRRINLNGAFIQFWTAYPRHEAKGQAEKAWISLKPDQALEQKILQAVDQQKLTGCLQTAFAQDGRSVIPLPASWLNAKRWQDEEPPRKQSLAEAIAADIERQSPQAFEDDEDDEDDIPF